MEKEEVVPVYDISFIMPVSDIVVQRREKIVDYGDRTLFFKKYGLLNIEDLKVKIFLLVGDENIPDIENGWDYPVEVVKDNYPYKTKRVCANKVHNFYASLTKERIDESRWFMQLDDDSITNVHSLVSRIDSDYDYLGKYNISNINPMSDMRIHFIFSAFRRVIEETSYKDILNGKNAPKIIPHGWESTIFSHGALMHFISNPNNKYILEKSLLLKETFPGDMLVSVCAILCGIPFYEVDYLEFRPYFSNFIVKKLFHIHYIYESKSYDFYARLAKLVVEK